MTLAQNWPQTAISSAQFTPLHALFYRVYSLPPLSSPAVQSTITPESTPSHADVLIGPRHVSLPLEFNRSFQQIFVGQESRTHEALWTSAWKASYISLYSSPLFSLLFSNLLHFTLHSSSPFPLRFSPLHSTPLLPFHSTLVISISLPSSFSTLLLFFPIPFTPLCFTPFHSTPLYFPSFYFISLCFTSRHSLTPLHSTLPYFTPSDYTPHHTLLFST